MIAHSDSSQFTTKKTSKYHVIGGHRVKSLGKPYSRRSRK